MTNVLFLLPGLDYSGDARQAALLAGTLARDRYSVECVSLGGPGPLAADMERARVPVQGHVGQRLFDVEDWFGLRRQLRERRPDVIHVWGLPAMRALRLASLGRWRGLPPLVVSGAGRAVRKGKLGWWSRRLLRRASRVVAGYEKERDQLAAAGVNPGRLVIVPPGVAPSAPPADPGAERRRLDLPDNARVLMAVGRMGEFDRFQNAVWAYDILRYLMPDLYLVLVGDGFAQPRLEAFGREVARGDWRIRFAGARPDAARLWHLADIALAPYRRPGGTSATLEAMAAGKPVLASALPNLAAIVRDGETGFLVPPHDAPALARRARQLLDDPALAAALGAAGRARSASFSTAAMAERFGRLYDDVAIQRFT